MPEAPSEHRCPCCGLLRQGQIADPKVEADLMRLLNKGESLYSASRLLGLSQQAVYRFWRFRGRFITKHARRPRRKAQAS